MKNFNGYKIPRYFDSPEGVSYLQTIKSSTESLGIAFSTEALTEDALPLTIEESVPIAPQVVQDEPQNNLLCTNPATDKVERKVKESQQKMKPHPRKKERILNLPSSILGAKPGAIPNTAHINRELEARRKINTVSTAKGNRKDANYGTSGFVVLPATCNFGELSNYCATTIVIEMTNVGLDSARFVVKLAKDSKLQIKYKHGPVAPGMGVQLSITLPALCDGCLIGEEIQIVSETEILKIPVKAYIKLA